MDKETFEQIKLISKENNIDLNELLGNYYLKIGDFINSLTYFDKYILTQPNDATVLAIIGYLYDELYAETMDNKYVIKAIEYTKKAHLLDKNNLQITSNLATMYNDTGFINEAYELYFELMNKNPSDKNCYDYAQINMRKGDFEEYYKYADKRLNLNIGSHLYPKFNKPMWQGEDISQSILLVHWEEGFGDTIMFSRYLQNLSQKAKKVIFVVQKELEELYKYNNFGCEIFSNISNVKEFDYHVPLASLMHISDVSATNLVYTDKYLSVDKNIADKFKNNYFKNNKYKIAIKYCGDKSGPVNRNIPRDKFIKFIKEIQKDDTEIYSFQFDDEDLKQCSENGIINLKNMTNNFYETLAIIENMDLVISTDNVILHLAGALGKNTIGLFNFASESRWFDLSGNDAKWYKSVKPYKAKNLNDWDNLLEKLKNDLL